MKDYILSFALLILLGCTENEISPEISGKLKRTTTYHSSDLSTPQGSGDFFYSNSGLLVKSQSFDSESELVKYSEFEYDNQDNLIKRTDFQSISGSFEKVTETQFFYNSENLNYKTEYYENGSLIEESNRYYNDFGKLEKSVRMSYPDNNVTETFISYDTSQRVLKHLIKVNGNHENSDLYEYPNDELDRYFWTFLGQDSVLWIEGEEKYVNDNIVEKRTYSHGDSTTLYNRYYYNSNTDLVKETIEKNGEQQVRIEKIYRGEFLIEEKWFPIDFSKTDAEYFVTFYDYY